MSEAPAAPEASDGPAPVVNPTLDGVRLQFQQQIDFFRAKLNLPSEHWDDIQGAAHDRGFMVAGATKADLLYDVRAAVDKSIHGETLETFCKDFAAAVRTHGWTGWTGEGTKEGEAWRTRIIYQTNVATSRAAGRRAQLKSPTLLATRPFWRYVHSERVMHARPLHKLWGDMQLTLPHDHPFWDTHFPPNGWGCMCYVLPVAAPDDGDATEPPEGWDTVNPTTGAPPGIDKGWAYAPGANADTELRQMVQDKLIQYPPAIAKALSADVNRYVHAQESTPDFVRRVLTAPKAIEPLWLGFVEDAPRVSAVAGVDVQGFLLLLPATVVRHVQGSHSFDGGNQRPPQPNDYLRLAELLNSADSLRAGTVQADGTATVVAVKRFGLDLFHAVFEVLTGKRNRALSLKTLFIKVPKQR